MIAAGETDQQIGVTWAAAGLATAPTNRLGLANCWISSASSPILWKWEGQANPGHAVGTGKGQENC